MSVVNAEKRMVSRIWHPAPPHDLHHLSRGIHAHVLKGDAGYQVSTGEKIAL